GFTPSVEEETSDVARWGIDQKDVIRRHGTDRDRAVTDVLSGDVCEATAPARRRLRKVAQPVDILWPGGYWDQRSVHASRHALYREQYAVNWRQEYLPRASELVAAAFAGCIAGVLAPVAGNDYRTTLHRVIKIGAEVLLQQACDYQGQSARGGQKGRTFR